MQKFKLAVSRKTGITTLWMACDDLPDSYVPIIGWSDFRGLKEFAEMLLEMYRNKQRQDVERDRIFIRLIEQAFTTTQYSKGVYNDK